MDFIDDDLEHFAANGAAPLPIPTAEGFVENEGARIRYTSYGDGPPVILLHGGLGHSGNWGFQVSALTDAGYGAVLVDSRGHGRSTRDDRPYSYDLMASDTRRVMDALDIGPAAFVGWSDGACTALVLAAQTPERAAGVLYFACNMDPSGVKPFEASPVIDRCLTRHRLDYAALSPTPDGFDALFAALQPMQASQPDYSLEDLASVGVPVAVVHSEHDEFIRREHAAFLARSIPEAQLVLLPGVSHFAPLQRPALFNSAMLDLVDEVL